MLGVINDVDQSVRTSESVRPVNRALQVRRHSLMQSDQSSGVVGRIISCDCGSSSSRRSLARSLGRSRMQ